MYIRSEGEPTGLCIVIAARSLIDSDLDQVLENMAPLNKLLGTGYVKRCLRIALRDYGNANEDKLPFSALAEHRAEIVAAAAAYGARCILTIGKPAFWCLHGKKANVEKWMGAPRKLKEGPWLLPTFAPWQYPGMFRPVLYRHFQRARDYAEGKLTEPFAWPEIIVEPGQEALTALEQVLASKLPIGFDVENAGKDARRDTLTALGIANKNVAVSLPWEEYSSGRYGHVRPLSDYPLGKQLREVVYEILSDSQIGKIMHNGAFDSQVMKARKVPFHGRIDDTLLLHRVLAESLKHDLQFVATCELPVAPWKAEFKNEDTATFVEVPEHNLRTYNAKDAAIEPPLFDTLMRQL